MTLRQSQGCSYKRNARYLGLKPFGRCSRQDPDMKSKKESRKIVISSHEQLILCVNILLCFGKFAPPPSGLILVFTSPSGLLLPLLFQTQLWGLSVAIARACPAQRGGQEIAICIFGLLCFWMEDLLFRGLELIFISWYQTEMQKINGTVEWNGAVLSP